MKKLLIALLWPLVASCENTEQFLDATQNVYGCIEIDGYFTDSQGRIIKVPEGQQIDQALVDSLCP